MKSTHRTLLTSAALATALVLPTAADAWWGWGPGWLGDGWGDFGFSMSFGMGAGGYGRGYGYGYNPYYFGYPYYGYPYYGYPVYGLPYIPQVTPKAATTETPEVAQK